MSSYESFLAVFVPEVEELVGEFRAEHDPSAALNIPAHITILYPFKPTTPEIITNLTTIFAQHAPFTITFSEIRRFETVLYLAPNPAAPFQALTAAVVEQYPENPPYGGQFDDVIPHLTIAHVETAAQIDPIIAQFEPAARQQLPIEAHVQEIILMDNRTGQWEERMRFRLGSSHGDQSPC